jgi:hypothetical protein
MKFQPGDIFFVMHHENKMSRLIAWFMNSMWSHSGIIAQQTETRSYTVETSDFNVTLSTLEQYTKDPRTSLEVWRHRGISDKTRAEIVENALMLDDKIFGYPQFISFAIRALLAKIGIKISHFITSGYVCCQVPLTGYATAGVPGFTKEEIKAIHTEELYQKVSQSPDFYRCLIKAQGQVI